MMLSAVISIGAISLILLIAFITLLTLDFIDTSHNRTECVIALIILLCVYGLSVVYLIFSGRLLLV